MDSVLCSSEIEFYIDTMKPTLLENIGTKQWLEWHQRLQKLNQEAVIEASAVKEEFVKETLISFEKVSVLVHEAILVNVWKNKILPLLLTLNPEPQTTFVVYSVLYHEAICVALLELIMFHSTASVSLSDAATDLLSYAYDAVSQLLVLELKQTETSESAKQEILRQKDDLAFDIGIRNLGIIRYIGDNCDRLPLNITNRLMNVHDVPILFVQLLLHKPWLIRGKLYKGGKWIKWDGEVLGQCEAQVWLTLCKLLMDPQCTTQYAITNSRRTQIVKLLPLMHPTLLDQLSPLFDLKYHLHQLSVSNQMETVQKPILLEPILEIKEAILKQGYKQWKKIARQQLPSIFPEDQQELREIAQGLADAYNTDLLAKFEATSESSAICSKCDKRAIQRCSRCKNRWYCSRKCQVEDWSKHKVNCVDSNHIND